MFCIGISVRYFYWLNIQTFTNSVFHSPYIPIKLNTKSFSTTSSEPTIYTLAHITVSFYLYTRNFDEYSLLVSGFEKCTNLHPCKICFQESKQNICLNISAKCMLLNVIICDIGPSCLPRSDVTLLKNNEVENVSNKRHYYQLLKLFWKG